MITGKIASCYWGSEGLIILYLFTQNLKAPNKNVVLATKKTD